MLLLAICYVEKAWWRNLVCWDLLEKLRVTQLLKKFPAFCGRQMLIFLMVVQKSIPWSLQGVIGIPLLLHLIYGIFIVVVSSHIRVCPPSHLVPFYEHFVSIYLFSSEWFDCPNYIFEEYKLWRPFLCMFPHPPLLSVCLLRAFSSTADTFSLSWGHVLSGLMGLIFELFSLEWQWLFLVI